MTLDELAEKIGKVLRPYYWFPIVLLLFGLSLLIGIFFLTGTVDAVPAKNAGTPAAPPATAEARAPASTIHLSAISMLFTPPPPASAATESSNAQAVQDFEKHITEECSAHREFLETMDGKLEEDTKLLGGAAILIFLAVFTLLGFRDRKGVEAFFQKNMNTELQTALDTFRSESELKRKNAIKAVTDNFQSRMMQEGDIETAVSQSLVLLGLYKGFKKISENLPPAVWEKDIKPVFTDIVERLKTLHAANPGNRLLAIQRARSAVEYCEANQDGLTPAIHIIEKTLKARNQEGNDEANIRKDEDDSALYYNLACYQNLLTRKLNKDNQADEAAKINKKAQNAIDKALELMPNDRSAARKDLDMTELRI